MLTPFNKSEKIGLIVIFAVLVLVSVPNFVLSLRRARDQVRRDDMGALQTAFGDYSAIFSQFPISTPDGRILDCIKPGDKVTIDKKGRLVANLIPCNWGQDAFVDLTPGSKRVFMPVLPRDPDYNSKGITYLYFSDGPRYQIFAYMEGGKDEADYNSDVVARHLMCGTVVCNVGRVYGCPFNKTLAQCGEEATGANKQISK